MHDRDRLTSDGFAAIFRVAEALCEHPVPFFPVESARTVK
jgi:hypothetical protein